MDTITVLQRAIRLRDPHTAHHQDRVAAMSAALGIQLGWDAERIEQARRGGLVHDLGKLAVPVSILNRPGPLSSNEYELIKEHPIFGVQVLTEDQRPPSDVVMIIEQHHERLDGSGYPNHLVASDINESAQIVAIADVFEAMTSRRSYRLENTLAASLDELHAGRGTSYHGDGVDALVALIEGHALDEAQDAWPILPVDDVKYPWQDSP
ncbi:MAG: HD domain-containing protein [Actinomycetia bacterium]|nr:HD domain-containing protein [Actinomycetes bacterium]